MNQAAGYLAAFIPIWYVALTFGCIMAHQPHDTSLKDPSSNAELTETVRAITCLIPEPTPSGIGLAVVVTVAADTLNIRDSQSVAARFVYC